MVEKILERKREPEPVETNYDRHMRIKNEKIRQRLESPIVIKGKDIPWEQSKQGFSKHYILEGKLNQVAMPDWGIFIQQVRKHSGCHIHQGGLAIFVLGGEGYSMVDGVKCEWEEGDLIILPIKPGGVEHQHFNAATDKPALWMAFRYEPMLDHVCVGITQVVEHPDWISPKQ